VTPHLALYSQEAIERRIASVVRQVGEWLATARGARQAG
jgi:phosphoglycerate dehydrogenase-like enzyme